MISLFVNPIWIFCHPCQHEAIKIFQGPRPILQWWQKYGAQREKDGTRCHFLQIDFLIHPITWRQYGLDYNSEWHSMICTRGDWKNSLMFSRNKAGKKMPKNMEESFFLQHFVKVFEARAWSQFQRKHIQAFPLDTKKERVKFGVWNQPSFLFTNQLRSFSCFKRFSPAQYKLDVSNAKRLDLIRGCPFIT